MINTKRLLSLILYNFPFIQLTLLGGMLTLITGCDKSRGEENSAYPIFYPFEMEAHFRGADDGGKISDKNPLEQGIYLYNQELYSASAQKFEEYLQTEPMHIMSKFYAGVAFLACNQPEKAYPFLFDAANDPYSDYQLHARWYLSIACLETQKLSEGRDLLLELQKDSASTEYSSRAWQILHKHPLLLCLGENMPIFNVKHNMFEPTDSSSISSEPQVIGIEASEDAKHLLISFEKGFEKECMLKLYNKDGLLVHMEKIANASRNSQTNISLTYKEDGLYNLLIQVGEEKIIPFRIRI